MSRARLSGPSLLARLAVAVLLATGLVVVTASGAGAETIRQHSSDEIAEGYSCPGHSLSMYRRFDLDGDHGITRSFRVSTVHVGFKTIAPGQYHVRLWEIPGSAPLVQENLQHLISVTSIVTVRRDDKHVSIPLGSDSPVLSDPTNDIVLSVEPNLGTELAVNNAGETRNSYISTEGCGYSGEISPFRSGHVVMSLEAEVLPDLTNEAPPVIDGTARVGELLTATAGSWSPEPRSASLQWNRNGAPIPGALGASYRATADDDGARITVTETVTRPGYARTTATSAPVEVQPGLVVNTTLPSIGGLARAHERLTVTPGSWEPAAVDLAYQWLADGAPVPGATGATYDLRAGDLGRRMTVEVTASKTAYTPVTVETAGVGPVDRCLYTPRRAPAVRGTLAVGETLAAYGGDWRPVPDGYAYEWLADGQPIPGATSDTYVLTAADLGRRISVRTTVSSAACEDATRSSDPDGPVGPGRLRSTVSPTIDGTPEVGKSLTVDAGRWNVEPTEVSFQWLRGGTAIPGATGASYTPSGADAGKWLSVRVRVTAPGYAAASVTSRASFPVAPAGGGNVVAPGVEGSARLGGTLVADPGEWSFDPEVVAYQWFAGARRIGSATGRELVLDDPSLVGRRVSVRVTAGAEGYATRTAASKATKPVRKAKPGLVTRFSTRTPTVGDTRVTIDVQVTAPMGVGVDGEVRVRVDGRRVATRAVDGGAVQVRLPVFKDRGRHKVVVRYGGSPALQKAKKVTTLRAQR